MQQANDTPEPTDSRRSRRGRLRRPRQSPPPMTLALAASLVLMALVQFTASGYQWQNGDLGSAPVDWALGAKVPSLIAHGEYWRLVTANFLHGSWTHLAMNLFSLYVVGRIIEAFYGPARMFVIFVLSAVAGAASSYLLASTVSLGASTGVLGLMGALIWHNWRYREHLPARLNYVYPLLLALVAFQFATDQILPGIDAYGHLGGFAAGAVVAMLLESRVTGDAQADRDWLPLPTALATAAGLLIYGGLGLLTALPGEMAMLRAGNTQSKGEQLRLVRSIVEGRPYFTEARLQLALLLLSELRFDEATREYQTAMAANPALATGRYGLSVRDEMVGFYMALADRLTRSGQAEVGVSCYQRVLQLNPSPRRAAEARNAYAWVLADRLNQNLDEAEQAVLRALEVKPEEPAYLDTLAWIYYKQGRADKALTTQLQAVKFGELWPSRLEDWEVALLYREYPALAELYYHLGAIYEQVGNRADARHYYAKALAKQANYPEARAGLDRVSEPSTEPGSPQRKPAGGTMI